MAPAVLHVVEEQKPEPDPVTIHHHNMVVKPAKDQPQRASAATQTHVQSMEAGVPGAMDPAVLHVVEEQKLEADPVTVHRHNMVVEPAQDQSQRGSAATQTYVQQMVNIFSLHRVNLKI